MCQVLLKPMSSLPLSKWRQRRSRRGKGRWGAGKLEESREEKLQSLCKINLKNIILKLNKNSMILHLKKWR